MIAFTRLAPLAALALLAGACTQADADRTEADAPAAATHTVVETREVAAPPVVVEREVPVVVIERDGRPNDRESTTVRAGQNGIEVETTRTRPPG